MNSDSDDSQIELQNSNQDNYYKQSDTEREKHVVNNKQSSYIEQSQSLDYQDKQQEYQSLKVKSQIKEGFKKQIDWNTILSSLEIQNDKMIIEYIEQLKMVITEIIDDKGFTLIHHAVLKVKSEKVKTLVEYAKKIQKLSDNQVKQWINAKTQKDSFTALHFASFKNNITSIQILIDNGADIHEVNKFGLSMLHVAAQGDAAASLYLFKELGLNINLKDNRGSTPLHWACYSQSEVALSYLVAWKPNLNTQDQEGFTPLHLAVKSVDSVDSTRPVRFLLIRGAKVDVKDNKGRLPQDLIKDVNNRDLATELQKMFNQKSFQFLMIRAPMKLVKKNPSTLILFVILLSFAYIIALLFIFSSNKQKFHQQYIGVDKYLVALNIIICFITILFFVLATIRDPGYLQNKGEVEFLQLLEQFDATQLCPDCLVIRTSRSRHCSICHKCVERFDHHCPWINNCVGINNHNFFITYITFQYILILETLVLAIMSIVQQNQFDEPIINNTFDLPFITENATLFYVFAFIELAMCTLFAVPLTLLVYVQINNYLNGKTTNERYARHSSETDDDTSNISQGVKSSIKVSEQNQGQMQFQQDFEIENEEDPIKRFQKLQRLQKKKKKTSIRTIYHNCYQMCCQTEIKGQRQIYQEYRRQSLNQDFNS